MTASAVVQVGPKERDGLSGLGAPGQSRPAIALIGCGAIAEEYYLPSLEKHRSCVKDLALVDSDQARAESLSRQFGMGKVESDYRRVIDDVEGVIVAVPTDLHHPIASDCLSRGVAVLCEKPLAESAAKAREMVRLAESAGVALAVNNLQRLWPQFEKVKELLEAGVLGRPLRIRYQVGEEFNWPTVSGFYFNAAGSARGVLRDRGAHVLDHICWWLGGRPRIVSCSYDSFGGSEAVVHVKFEDEGCSGEIILSWLAGFPSRFSVVCERGAIEGEVYDFRAVTLRGDGDKPERIALKKGIRSKADAGYRVVGNFIDVIRSGGKPLISGEDVLGSIEMIDECYEVAKRFDMPWYDMLGDGNVP
jgi:UDP-N-acetylglucosamine 3-dehydrogenase